MRAYERLMKYSSIPSASKPGTYKTPSTDIQFDMAKYLVEEMKSLGIEDAKYDENGYVTGTIESNYNDGKERATVGFIAHMDTVDDVPYENVNCVLQDNFDGETLRIGKDLVLSADDYPFLKNYKGKTILSSDGTTLIGADDKAGVAEIMTLAETLYNNPKIKHSRIRIGFTPDEEIGEGADHFDVEGFGADFAYTLDGAAAGEVEFENFNACDAELEFTGFSIHPGSAKDKMKNASLMVCEFNSMLPKDEIPAKTEGYEGFYHLVEMSGEVENAKCLYIIRDHDKEKFEKRKEFFMACVDKIKEKYGDDCVRCEMQDSYYNMSEIIMQYPETLELARKAAEKAGLKSETFPIRGGTDGARLSFMGLPCPNLGTGSHNHHGRSEFAVVEEMDKVSEMLVELVQMI